jgi:hypothetical protein
MDKEKTRWEPFMCLKMLTMVHRPGEQGIIFASNVFK